MGHDITTFNIDPEFLATLPSSITGIREFHQDLKAFAELMATSVNTSGPFARVEFRNDKDGVVKSITLVNPDKEDKGMEFLLTYVGVEKIIFIESIPRSKKTIYYYETADGIIRYEQNDFTDEFPTKGKGCTILIERFGPGGRTVEQFQVDMDVKTAAGETNITVRNTPGTVIGQAFNVDPNKIDFEELLEKADPFFAAHFIEIYPEINQLGRPRTR